MALTLVSFGMVVAVGIKQFQSFIAAVTQMLVMPLLFLSVLFTPSVRSSDLAKLLTRVDPLTYAVDPLRKAVFRAPSQGARDGLRRGSVPGVTWDGWHVPVGLELGWLR